MTFAGEILAGFQAAKAKMAALGKPPMIIASLGNGSDPLAQTLQGYEFTTLNLLSGRSWGGTFDPVLHTWSPTKGGYFQFVGRVRPRDTTAANTSYGVGIDTANRDSATGFQWTSTVDSNGQFGDRRNGLAISRLMYVNPGDKVRLFAFVDGNSSYGITNASLYGYLVSE